MRTTILLPVLIVVLTILLTSGCDENQRLAKMAEQSSERQAQQNREMAKLNQQVSENAKQIVTADQEARKEVTQLQREIIERDSECRSELNTMQQQVQQASKEERQGLDRQRENIESERRDIADKRHRDPIIATAIMQVGLVLACLLPLIFCVYLMRALRNEGVSEQAVAELLVEELMAAQSPLLGAGNLERPAIGVERPLKLPATPQDDANDEVPQ